MTRRYGGNAEDVRSDVADPADRIASMPRAISAMLAAQVPEPFDSPGHIFELLWSGVRAFAHVKDGRTRLQATNGRDLSPYFPELTEIGQKFRAGEAILDGDIVATNGEGHPSFELLRSRLHLMAKAASPGRNDRPDLPLQFKLQKIPGALSYQAFDLLWLEGASLEERPLWQRKNRLHQHVISGPEFAPVDFVDYEGNAFFAAVIDRRLEGIVAKQKNSSYVQGRRSREWLEVRAQQSGDFLIGGYAIGGARRYGEPFSQLLLGAYVDGRYEYVGAVSGGMNDKEARALIDLLDPLLVTEPPFFDPPPIQRLIYWTRPVLPCRVRFSEWSADGHLRFPIFSSLRPDLSPSDCTIET